MLLSQLVREVDLDVRHAPQQQVLGELARLVVVLELGEDARVQVQSVEALSEGLVLRRQVALVRLGQPSGDLVGQLQWLWLLYRWSSRSRRRR